jgi:hypothetical protein
MNILICTIIRDRSHHLDLYCSQINELVRLNPDLNFQLSVYENDSTDNTVEHFKQLKFDIPVTFKNETLRTRRYGSWKAEERVKLLAEARNKCIDAVKLDNIDKLIFIEPDIRYKPELMRPLLISNYDVISPRSITSSSPTYDGWGWRMSKFDVDGGLAPTTDTEVWATFHCFVVYNSQPFKLGARFSSFNKHLSTWDCDTVVVVNNIQELGFNKVMLKGSLTVEHL